jgi:hypothetical protein
MCGAAAAKCPCDRLSTRHISCLLTQPDFHPESHHLLTVFFRETAQIPHQQSISKVASLSNE